MYSVFRLISTRLISAIALLGIVASGALVFSVIAFDSLQSEYAHLSDQTLPLITDTANIGTASQAIASISPILASSATEYERQSINDELSDRIRLLDRHLYAVIHATNTLAGEVDESVGALQDVRALLITNVLHLDAAVQRRLALEQRAERLRETLSATLSLIRAVDRAVARRHIETQGLPEATILHEVQEWLARSRRTIDRVMRSEHASPTVRAQQIAEVLDDNELEAPNLDMDALHRAGVLGLYQHLQDNIEFAFNEDDGFPITILQTLEQSRQISGLIAENSRLAGLFSSAVARLIADLQSRTLAERTAFERLADNTLTLMIGVAIGTVLAVFGLALMIRSAVLRRLQRLAQAMLGRVLGEQTPIPADGHDEIAQIGQAAQHFVDTIAEREQRERRAKTAAERLAGEATAANRAKTIFLANMSHELRTPLNAIIGFSEMIQMGIGGQNQARDYAGSIHEAGHHLLSLINDLLDLSQIEAGRRDFQLNAVDAAELISGVEPLVRLALDSRQLRLRLDVAPDIVIMVDHLAFRQVLLNLLSNAAKFAHHATDITIICRKNGGMAQITVVDEGVGIAQSEIDRVLEPFQQEVHGHIRQSDGAGLGLAIVRAIVTQHGGDITVKSQKGAGTAVSVSFPLAHYQLANTG